jgi:N-acetylmuramoyl-L-alanine amidase
VQFKISLTEKSLQSTEFKELPEIFSYKHNNYFKYTAGKYETFRGASEFLKVMQSKGYKDAFIVAFLNNERIPLNQAKQISGE